MAQTKNITTRSLQPIALTFGITEINLISFTFSDYAVENKKLLPFDGYEFQFKFDLSIDEIKKQCGATFFIELFERRSITEKIQLAELQSHLLFTIENFHDVIKKAENDVNFLIPDQILGLLAGLSLSTNRGIFAAKMDGTIYENAIIPVIDSSSFIPPKPNQ